MPGQVRTMDRVVGMGEYHISDKAGDVLRTFALASCVAVTAYSPSQKAAGMLHVVLPAPLNSKDPLERPGYFAQTGVPLLINAMCRRYGCQREELRIQLFGGANSVSSKDVYRVGKKNIDAVTHSLLEMGLTAIREDLRGNESRTLEMDVTTGEIRIFRQPL